MSSLIDKGSTNVTDYIFVQDSSATDGRGLTGLVYNSASLVASYVRAGGSRTAITLATQTVTGAYSEGGFVEVDATNMPGVYRIDLPDDVFATGADVAVVMLKGATNMAPVPIKYWLVDVINSSNPITADIVQINGNALTGGGGTPADFA